MTAKSLSISDVASFEALLAELSGFQVTLIPETASALVHLLAEQGASPVKSIASVSDRFFATVNRKLKLNRISIASLYTGAAALGITFNFHQKRRLEDSIDSNRLDRTIDILRELSVTSQGAQLLVEGLVVSTHADTQQALRSEVDKPSKLRKAHARDVTLDVFASCAGPLVWALWPAEALYSAFGGGGTGEVSADYLDYLKTISPELFNRERTLAIRYVGGAEASDAFINRSAFSRWIANEFEGLSNHGYLALVVEVDPEDTAASWGAVQDATIFAERFNQINLRQMFFRREDVARETSEHIPDLRFEDADFDVLNEGFTYRDVFVLTKDDAVVTRLVLLLQKNVRDETPVPCPDCRSTNVEGNSYSSLGVKSWACKNPLCPARSIYNRGRRFQFKSILSQAAIEDLNSQLSVKTVRRWQRDVLQFESDTEIVETLIAHHSIWGDGVAILNFAPSMSIPSLGRLISRETTVLSHARTDFWDSAFFNRYPLKNTISGSGKLRPHLIQERPYEVISGDSTKVLRSFPESIFDRAVTSPPYFNAREYSQWANLYTYLYDMAENASEVFRVLKPGGIYAFNIFDYFDNERTVVFSDMGKKRIPLSALMTDVFLRLGFVLDGVIPWDKGEIQGKRGFNAGNFSPFYQAPFNCWEHVLLLKKPVDVASSENAAPLPNSVVRSVAKIHPVVKMIRGTNTYGHSAPYPIELVDLLLGGLEPGAWVLDPYAGSGTTARAALSREIRSVVIERDPVYADLAARLTEAFLQNRTVVMPLF